MGALQSQFPTEYRNAEYLIKNGVPVFLVRRADEFPSGGSGDTGYHFPSGWQHTTPNTEVLDQWQPGDGLGAVMGHTVDGLDLDPRNGGSLNGHSPNSYGRQTTPSGGTHDLIAPLGVASVNGLMPGVDLKSGAGSSGRGFIFLAPTERRSKVTDEVVRYRWVKDPDLDTLLVQPDESGKPLAQIASQSTGYATASYFGAKFEDLTDSQQRQARGHVESMLFDWSVLLGEAATWPDGYRDSRGRGWEALTRDFAWAVAMEAVCPWAGLTEAEAQQAYVDALPEVIASDPKCSGKLYPGVFEKAASYPVAVPPWWEQEVFEQTPTLKHIRDAAHARIVSPTAVLALVLGRVLTEVPPSVMLPPVIATAASLNLGIAVTAGSGGGKSSAIGLSAQLLENVEQEHLQHGLGSGEGLTDLFLQEQMHITDKGEYKPTGKTELADDPRAIIICDEVEQLEALGAGRSGSTLSPIIRDLLTGDALMMSNAKVGNRTRRVAARSYRGVMVVGVQPSASDALLSAKQVGVGTPQRFLWCSALDPSRPQIRPQYPGPLEWRPPRNWPDLISYPSEIADQIVQSRIDFVDGKAPASDGHLMLTRLKVAFALAVLHGDTYISLNWWDLAGLLIDQSSAVQQFCRDSLSEAALQRDIARATRAGVAEVEAGAEIESTRLNRCAKAIFNRAAKTPHHWFSWREIRPNPRLLEGFNTAEVMDAVRAYDPDIAVYEHQRASGPSHFQVCYQPQQDPT